MPLETLNHFGYPKSLIKEYEHWYLLLRTEQVTLGSLVLICKEQKTRFSDLSQESFGEYSTIIREVERNLEELFHYDQINHLALMMVQRDVHFHIIPRYSELKEFHGTSFKDHGWPAVPMLGEANAVSQRVFQELCNTLRTKFEASMSPKRFTRVYTTGCFDVFHVGHLNILRRSKEIADFLIVGISTDALMEEEKGVPPTIKFSERLAIVSAIGCVDEVISQVDKDKENIVKQYKIDAITVGDNWRGKYPPVSCEVVYFPYTKNVSSSLIKREIRTNHTKP